MIGALGDKGVPLTGDTLGVCGAGTAVFTGITVASILGGNACCHLCDIV